MLFHDNTTPINENQFVLYQLPEEEGVIQVVIKDETIWATQKAMASLFGVDKSGISRHIANILKEGELRQEMTVAIFATVINRGKRGEVEELVDFYNLDMIISVGYRVNSAKATKFRIWATTVLKEYIRKGFVLDDNRLKNLGGGGYWKELLERIRDIRSSEKVFYRQVLDIYATSIDYDPHADISVEFFKRVQNKIHYAIHGQTAAEVNVNRADAEKEFMGLTTFEGDRPHLKDAVIAKNHLDEKELRAMGQIVSGYPDFAERQAERQQTMTMKDWATHLDSILTMSGEKLLQGTGKVSHQEAIEHDTNEYKKYQQRTLSQVEKDFLDNIKSLPKK
ncbi:MAG: virulence RhuM family protein [Bacteroidales bacterium]|nr:virulence RhuM family protein [Bacteroidales bacterium]